MFQTDAYLQKDTGLSNLMTYQTNVLLSLLFYNARKVFQNMCWILGFPTGTLVWVVLRVLTQRKISSWGIRSIHSPQDPT